VAVVMTGLGAEQAEKKKIQRPIIINAFFIILPLDRYLLKSLYTLPEFLSLDLKHEQVML
jgi:hypothetical protein